MVYLVHDRRVVLQSFDCTFCKNRVYFLFLEKKCVSRLATL